MTAPADVEVTAALLILKRHMESTSDPLTAVEPMTELGVWLLRQLGFEVTAPAHVKIDIPVDDLSPDHARISLTWPIDDDDVQPDAFAVAASGVDTPAELAP